MTGREMPSPSEAVARAARECSEQERDFLEAERKGAAR